MKRKNLVPLSLENCQMKTEPNSGAIDSFGQWESDPRDVVQADAKDKTKNPKRRTDLSLYENEERKKRRRENADVDDGGGKHVCSLCSRIFNTQILLDQHCANHDLMIYKCAVCGWAYNAAYLVESHIRRHHYKEQEGDLPKLWVKGNMACRLCFQKFNSLFSLEVHMKSHGDEIKCHNCDRSFRSLDRLLRHQDYCPNQKKQKGAENTGEPQISARIHQSLCPSSPRKSKVAKKVGRLIRDLTTGTFKCPHDSCGWECKTYDGLIEHGGTEHGGLCPYCPRTIAWHENLVRHIRDHKNGKYPFSCPHGGCRWNFKTYGELHSHRRRHGGLLICPRCHTEVWSKAVYDEYARKCIAQLQCENCPAVFSSNDELKAHECSLEENDTNVEVEQCQKTCSICKEIFLSKTMVESYATNVRGKYRCTECAEEFKTFGHANYHAYAKHFGMVRVDIGSAKLYKCYSCTRRFTTLGRLKQHLTYHAYLKYKCTRPGCGWVFDQNEFQVHISIYHTRPDVPKVQSEEIVCPKCLPVLQMLEGNECFKCSECPKTFASKEQRFEHVIAEHVGGQMKKIPFTCSLCTRQFPSKSKLQDHVKNHQLLEWKCPECGWTFENKKVTAEHIKERHGSGNSKPMMVHTIYKCSECGKDFPDAGSIGNHMRTHAASTLESTKTKNSSKGESPALNTKEKQIIKLVMQKRVRVITENPANTSEEKSADTSTENSTKTSEQKPVKKSRQELTKIHASICITCGWVFSNPEQLKSHVMSEHKKKSSHSNTFGLKPRQNVQEYSEIMECKCPHCGNTYTKLLELQTHLNNYPGHFQSNTRVGWPAHISQLYGLVTRCKCTLCGKIFSNHQQLKSHVICEHARKSSAKEVSDLNEVYLEKMSEENPEKMSNEKSIDTAKANASKASEEEPVGKSGQKRAKIEKCLICHQAFSNPKLLKSHVISEHENKSPPSNSSDLKATAETRNVQGYSEIMECKCSYCGNTYTTLQELQAHLNSHPKHFQSKIPGGWQAHIANLCRLVTKCKCNLCGKIFSSHGLLKSHVTEEHGRKSAAEEVSDLKVVNLKKIFEEKPMKFGQDGGKMQKSTSEEKPVNKSESERAKIQNSTCITGDQEFLNPEVLKSHVMSEHKKKSPDSNISDLKTTLETRDVEGYSKVLECKCPDCETAYRTLLELQAHLESHPQHFQSNTRGGWQAHISNLYGLVTRCKCTLCGMIFYSHERLKFHVIWEHAEEISDLKEKTFEENPVKKSEHERAKIQKFTCVTCNQVFSNPELLKSHVMREHEKKSPASNARDLILVPVQGYSEVMECKIPHCGQTFNTLLELQAHLNSHPEQYQFSTRGAWQAHIASMYGCTNWQCTFCAKIFLSHDQLKSHVINAHGRKSAEDMFDLKPAPEPQNQQDSSEVMECNTVESHRLQDSSEVKECNTVESHRLQDSSEVMECNTVESHRLQDSSEVKECNTVESHRLQDSSEVMECNTVESHRLQDSSEVKECNTVESHRLQDSSEVKECNTVESRSISDRNTTTGVRRAKPSPLYKYNTKYRCEYCDKIFSNPKQLRSHVICEHEPRKSSASNASASKTRLKVRNVQDYSEVMECRCSHCGETFRTLADLQKHFRSFPEHYHSNTTENRQTHISNLYGYVTQCKCAVCGKVFSSHEELKAHGICEHEWKSSASDLSDLKPRQTPRSVKELCDVIQCKCVQCGHKYETLKELQDHLTNVPEHDKCDAADLQPSRIAALFGSVSQCRCPLCGAVFNSHAQLKSHVICEHEKYETSDLWPSSIANLFRDLTQSKCPLCAKVFPNEEELKSHVICGHDMTWKSSGADAMQGKCLLCEKVFSSYEQLKSHVICEHERKSSAKEGMGHKEKPECVFCGEIFPTQDKMKSHILSEHVPNVNPFCSFCRKMFPDQHKLKSHIRAEHSSGFTEKSLCTLCGETFESKDQLKSHTICEHHTKNTKTKTHWKYIVECTCSLCGMLVENPAWLKAHMREIHGEQQLDAKENYVVKFRSLKAESGVGENENTKTETANYVGTNKYIAEFSCSICGKFICSETAHNTTVRLPDPARLKAHTRQYHTEQPGVKANYMVMFKSLKMESDVEENDSAKKSRSSRWTSPLVPKNQLEGYTIDEEAKANTVWVNVPTIKQGTNPSRGMSRSSVLVPDDDESDYDSDATISVTDGNYDSDATISVTDGGDIYSTQGYPLLVLHRVSAEDIDQMTTSTETFHNIFA